MGMIPTLASYKLESRTTRCGRARSRLTGEMLEYRTLLAADGFVDLSSTAVGLQHDGNLDQLAVTDTNKSTATFDNSLAGLLGDANHDGTFDQRDLIQLVRAGKYLTGSPADWSEGDFNLDRVFDQKDLVAALQYGAYSRPSDSAADGGHLAVAVSSFIEGANAELAEQGLDYRVVMAEYITGDGDEVGNTVIAKDVGNKQLGFDFVPFDPRRGWSGPVGGSTDNITYAVDTTFDAVPPLGGLVAAQTDAAIDRAMATWDSEQCSVLPITRNPDFGIDIGVIAFIFSGGVVGSPFVFGDIQHAGWRDLNFPGGILGVTFTFGFVDGSGNFTDVDNNGKLDTAFREIYYDPSFVWKDDGVSNFDVETVALHEAGHGLSQGHFGKVFIKNDGSLMVSPPAVMNAFYTGPQRSLLGTDTGGHCSNWAEWPNN